MFDVVVKLITLLKCICLDQHVFLVKSITMLDRKGINIKQQILMGTTMLYMLISLPQSRIALRAKKTPRKGVKPPRK
jgi:hypothetical protein